MGDKVKIELVCVGPRDGERLNVEESDINSKGIIFLDLVDAEMYMPGILSTKNQKAWVRTGRKSTSSECPLFAPLTHPL